MSKIAIKGHASRGKEVIELLEMLGGKNIYNLFGDTSCAYYVLENSEICCGKYIYGYEPYTFFTLEEFFENFQYKIGDRVRVPEYISEDYIKACINKMYWDGSEVQYEVVTDEVEWYSTKELNEFNKPDKEETMEGDKAKAPDLRGQDYSGRRFGYKIPNGYEFDCIKNNEIILKPIKPQYPKNYDECCQYLGCDDKIKMQLIGQFTQLINARNAYWKIAGEQMGLDKSWEPDFTNIDEERYGIYTLANKVERDFCGIGDVNMILTFPTEEMRDIFFENFKDLINECKELL